MGLLKSVLLSQIYHEGPIALRVMGVLRQLVLVMVWLMLSLVRVVLLVMVGVLCCCVLLEH